MLRRTSAAFLGVNAFIMRSGGSRIPATFYSSQQGVSSPQALLLCSQPTASLNLQRRRYSSTGDDDFDDDEEEGFTFDSTASMAKDVKKSQQGDIIDRIVKGILGDDNVTEEKSSKVKEYLTKFPINNAIVADKVKVTHTLDDKGNPLKCSLPEMSFEDALNMAKENNLDLVQLSMKDGLAFCRMRDEKSTILKIVGGEASVPGMETKSSKETKAPAENQPATNLFKYAKGFKLSKDIGDVEMTDVSDDHFCKWKGKKVVDAFKRGHSVRVTVKQFQSPELAISQLRKFVDAVAKHASDPHTVPFHIPQVKAAHDQVAVLLQPVDPSKQPFIKLLADRDWSHHLNRLNVETEGKGNYKRKVKETRNFGVGLMENAQGKTVVVDKAAQSKIRNRELEEMVAKKKKAEGDFWTN